MNLKPVLITSFLAFVLAVANSIFAATGLLGWYAFDHASGETSARAVRIQMLAPLPAASVAEARPETPEQVAPTAEVSTEPTVPTDPQIKAPPDPIIDSTSTPTPTATATAEVVVTEEPIIKESSTPKISPTESDTEALASEQVDTVSAINSQPAEQTLQTNKVDIPDQDQPTPTIEPTPIPAATATPADSSDNTFVPGASFFDQLLEQVKQ